MSALVESFKRFSSEVNQIAEIEGKKAASTWEDTFKEGRLTELIHTSFLEISYAYSSILNQGRGRNTTIQPSLFEIFVGKLIKHCLDTRLGENQIEVLLDRPLPSGSGKVYPDILVRKDGNPLSVIELKHILKKGPYEGERNRRRSLLQHYSSLKTYSVIVFAIYDESAISTIVEDKADWIYIIRYAERAEEYKNRTNIPFLNRENPVELALQKIIEASL
jgi:hypothetical protein